MSKVAIAILTDTETHESLGRLSNALMLASEISENNEEVRIIFDGAGTKWIPELENEDHPSHKLYSSLKKHIAGACKFCSKAFGVLDKVESSDIPLLDEYRQHPSLRKYIRDGYQVITF